jgi:glucosylglycerate synthase
LADESFLTDDFLRQLINVGEVDILIGLPTHNNAKTIGPILQTIQAGILQWFPRDRAVIINADGGSRDGTPELVTGVSIDDVRRASNLYALRTLHSISTKYGNSPAEPIALRTILAAAELLQAKACVVMSPHSSNIESEWIAKLLRPVRGEGFDLVTPMYRRHKFEGLLITNLIYPMTRALYGFKIREPYMDDFGFSSRLGSEFLLQNAWSDGDNSIGVELQFTLSAIKGGRKICQTFLGEREHIDHRGADLVPALRRTVGTLFAGLDADFSIWSADNKSQPVTTVGPDHEILMEPLRVNRKRLCEMFSTGVAELKDVFQQILTPSTLGELQRIAGLDEDAFDYPARLWVNTVYEFAASYQKSVINRDHIIQSLAPLFRGRALTFLTENRNADAEEVEGNIEALCVEFERQKPSLVQMWKAKE